VYFGFYIYRVCICSICRYMIIAEESGYRKEVESVYFMDNGCRGREKIIDEADRNFMREGGNEKKDRNNCI